MKTCVFIIGTNCSGKSTLARGLMAKFGGIVSSGNTLTRCGDNRCSFAGKYTKDTMYGGVDRLNSTARLAPIVREALETSEAVVCEGSYLDTFGMNLTNAIFEAKAQLVVFLFASGEELQRRLKQRSGGVVKETIAKKQERCLRCARKWKSVGVPVMVVDTNALNAEQVTEQVYEKIIELIMK